MILSHGYTPVFDCLHQPCFVVVVVVDGGGMTQKCPCHIHCICVIYMQMHIYIYIEIHGCRFDLDIRSKFIGSPCQID